ncbi:MAG TPA: fibronectin type III domain-containing protein, partial [Solirubrobacterales bacterium]|nr:fibronectin type III domain-containing protein [Solirubrobacterales bacterium]
MRRHAKASSAGPTPRRAKSFGRIALLAAVAATFLFASVAQAAAGTLHVGLAGTGTGEVSSAGGFEGSGLWEGNPPIECKGPPPSVSSVCDTVMVEEEGLDGVGLTAVASADSQLAGWNVEEGAIVAGCESSAPSCFVAGFGGNAKVTVTFNLIPTGPDVVTNPGATEIAQTSAKVSGTVNPKGKAVSECKVQYGLTESYGSEADCESLPGSGESAVPVEKTLSGLTPNKTYHFRFKATNADGSTTGSDQTFKTLPEAPAVITTPGATEILQTMAKVAGSVNPNGASVSECKIEYGLTESYGSEANCEPAPGSGESPVAVSKTLTGLVANTTYHFRVKASNPGGTSNGSDQTFTTLALVVPSVTTEAATGETKTTANLNGSVNPNGDPTSCHFEYGLTTSYGSEASCASPPGSGYDPVSASAAISGLTLNTTYHFRLVASNGAGTENGSDLTFTTKSTTP